MTDLPSLGWDERFAAAYAPFERTGHRPARVARVESGVCRLLGVVGAERASLGGGMIVMAGRDRTRLPCVGDWVVVRDWPDGHGTIEAVLPRRTILIWPSDTPSGEIVAANVDAIRMLDAGEEIDLEPLRAHIEPGRTLALIGPPGVRKSSLVRALVGADLLVTRCHHATDGPASTCRTLLPVPGGGAIIDTCGWHHQRRQTA